MQAKRKEERRVATRWNEEEEADVVVNRKGFDVGSTVCAQSCAYAIAVYLVAGKEDSDTLSRFSGVFWFAVSNRVRAEPNLAQVETSYFAVCVLCERRAG